MRRAVATGGVIGGPAAVRASLVLGLFRGRRTWSHWPIDRSPQDRDVLVVSAHRAGIRSTSPLAMRVERPELRLEAPKSKDNKHSSRAEIELPLPAAYVEKPLNGVEREFDRVGPD